MAHVPCDIVLVIDVSGSMNEKAPPPKEESGKSQEDPGFSVLDLTKHAAFTILSTLDKNDRLGIVQFSNSAEVILDLVEMTEANKTVATDGINKMKPNGTTNLKGGIATGLKLFQNNANTGRVPALMILTDGQPTDHPSRGFVQMIQSKGTLPATIHTFGFGYHLDSGILKSIAEVGGGNYSFIPDSGMIGTVFVHAVAHLQSTYATKCVLEITSPQSIELKTTTGKSLTEKVELELTRRTLTINLDNLQYGQSRDIYLQAVDAEHENNPIAASASRTSISAKLNWSRMREARYTAFVSQNLLDDDLFLSDDVVAYQQSRSMLCHFLSSFFSLKDNGEYGLPLPTGSDLHLGKEAFEGLLSVIPAQLHNDEYNRSIMDDLKGEPPKGQVSIALSAQQYFMRWGRHYFLSLWNAHAKQLCNSFKDPGPMLYNKNCFFESCRDTLDTAFNEISPPEASRKVRNPAVVTYMSRRTASTTPYHSQYLSMKTSYNSSTNICFGKESKVELESGGKVPIRTLQKDMLVRTLRGPRRVVAVVHTMMLADGAAMCTMGDLVVTPWHPILLEGRDAWVFPDQVMKRVRYIGPVYSVLLERDPDVDAHSIKVEGVWGVTLGHGLTRDDNDVRAHPFFGNYQRVEDELAKVEVDESGGMYCHEVERVNGSGLICGFKGRSS